MLEKLGGVVIILVATTALCLISALNPPTFIQIICAFVGAIVYLMGVVILFAEGTIFTKDRQVKPEMASEIGKAFKVTAS